MTLGIENQLWDCICGGVALIVYAWNAPFYRRPFDYAGLENSLRSQWRVLMPFRDRALTTLHDDDGPQIEQVFIVLMRALMGGRARAQVSAAKALHVMGPNFFPMWDYKIAHEIYNCPYYEDPELAYFAFCRRIRQRVMTIQPAWDSLDKDYWLRRKVILKRIDEFNFMRRPPTAATV